MAGRADDVPTPSLRQAWRTVAVAGLLAGTFDITFAFVFYGRQGVNPARLLRGIASGVLGPTAFTLAGWTVALGAALHFFIALCAAFIYWGASRRLSVLTRRPLLSGAAFGVAMYVAMHFIVLPLSRVHFRLPSLPNVLGELFSHVVLFGMVIALGVARAAPRNAERW
ncbi:MAG TPA: hypothetical protein VLX08_06420 [Steroidobacteraceae bacterium]|nr:hypothetical protein [Steroidobacteraceae bacterium]